MLEKLLLAVTITFCLNLFLGVRLPNTTTASSYHLAETPTLPVRLLDNKAWSAEGVKEESFLEQGELNILTPGS